MADWQAPALGDDEEDWLCSLATTSETDREVVHKGLFICKDVETEYPVMPKDELDQVKVKSKCDLSRLSKSKLDFQVVATLVPELWSGRRWERYMVRESASNSMFAN
ncbi:hypothetical protein B0H14DRAFT_2584030 [Mycena olivaceomarginata]|nr:hypothetical protein B0H14DRAFT_2584030 [Mycena olivaceomarginata]